MSDDQIRDAIVEACGWTYDPITLEVVFIQDSEVVGIPWPSLDAMHKAEELVFNKNEWHTYTDFLIDEVLTKNESPIRATAKQRAEALLKTLGKWKL